MGEIVIFGKPKSPSVSKQRGVHKISARMYRTLRAILDEENAGRMGLPPCDLNLATYKALWNRGLIAHFERVKDDDFYCLSPPGREAVASWERND